MEEDSLGHVQKNHIKSEPMFLQEELYRRHGEHLLPEKRKKKLFHGQYRNPHHQTAKAPAGDSTKTNHRHRFKCTFQLLPRYCDSFPFAIVQQFP